MNKKLELDDWQKEVLRHKGDLLLCTGRRVGKTQIMANKAAEKMISKPGVQIIIASLTEDQAKLIIIMIQDYLTKNYKVRTTKIKKEDKWTQNKVSTNNGSVALARPVGNTGDAIRGFNGQVLILDEVSRFSELIMTAATPVLLTTGGEIWAASTPYGKQGFFWKQFNEGYNIKDPECRFKIFYKTSEDVIYNRKISESWTLEQREKAIRFLNKEKRDMSKLVYGQEYLGLFMEDLSGFFEDKLIKQTQTLTRTTTPQSPHTKNTVGCDIARLGGDDNSYQVISEINGRFFHLESFTEKGKPIPQTERDIMQFAELWKAKKIGIDAGSGSLGVSIYDHLRETKWKNKVVAINNRVMILDQDGTKQRVSKEDYYNNLKSMMEHGEIKLLDDEKVRLSLKSVQYAFVMKHDQPTRMEIFSNPHSDSHIIEALVRAAWLAKKEKNLSIWIDYF